MSDAHQSAEAQVRALLLELVAGRSPSRMEAEEALAAFERLHPSPAEVAVPHAWCTCGHEHSRYASTGEPAKECGWVFCDCQGFRQRAPLPPSREEREELARRFRQQQKEWWARNGGAR